MRTVFGWTISEDERGRMKEAVRVLDSNGKLVGRIPLGAPVHIMGVYPGVPDSVRVRYGDLIAHVPDEWIG